MSKNSIYIPERQTVKVTLKPWKTSKTMTAKTMTAEKKGYAWNFKSSKSLQWKINLLVSWLNIASMCIIWTFVTWNRNITITCYKWINIPQIWAFSDDMIEQPSPNLVDYFIWPTFIHFKNGILLEKFEPCQILASVFFFIFLARNRRKVTGNNAIATVKLSVYSSVAKPLLPPTLTYTYTISCHQSCNSAPDPASH